MTRINEPGGTGFGRIGRESGEPVRRTQVQPGERTLAQVAQRLRMLEDLLRLYNPQLNPSALEPGQDVFLTRRFTRSQSGAEAMGAGQAAGSAAAAQERNFEAMFEAAMRKSGFQPQPGAQEAASQPPAAQPMFNPAKLTLKKTSPFQTSPPPRFEPEPKIPPYDPKVGPRITPDMWTMEMLCGPLTQDLLANQKDPAAFLNARKSLLTQPTPAKVVSLHDGSSNPLSPQSMATVEQAEGMREYLVKQLGMLPVDITDQAPVGAFRVDWGNDPRRLLGIGPLSVGALLMRYATTPKELADQQTREELKAAGLLNS
jgi:hypothetical protein